MSARTVALDELRLFAAASPAGFGWAATREEPEPYVPARFHLELSKAVVDVFEGRLDVLIVQMPVQHGKSTTASQLGAAQFLGTHPERYVVAVSYSTDYAADNIGSKARGWLERYGPRFFNVTVDPRSSARHRWNVVPGGGGLATFGIDKGVAGRRADLLIVDDPYPGIREAASKTFRDNAWERYQFELATRLAPGAGQIHIMSRWGDDDHIARLVKHCRTIGLRYRIIDFPALAICGKVVGRDSKGEPEICGSYGLERINECGHGCRDELGRLPGEALWPEVRPREFLLKQRVTVGTRAFDALFQGRPRPDGGLMFGAEWFRYYEILDNRIMLKGDRIKTVPLQVLKRFQMCDPAASTAENAARFRIGTFGMTPERDLAILNMAGGTLGAPAAKKLVRAEYLRAQPFAIGVEDAGMGLVFVQDLVADGLPIKGIKADRDKVTRATVAQILYENHKVYHPDPLRHPWCVEMEEELKAFPGGPYKDQVDVISMAAIAVSQAGAGGAPIGIRIG